MRPRHALPVLVGVLLVSGCASTVRAPAPVVEEEPAGIVQMSDFFQSGGGTAVTYDEALVPVGGKVALQSRSTDGTTTVRLAVRSLEPLRGYGAQVHTDACGDEPQDAGAHYQFSMDPNQPSTDPRFSNAQNEIWLDFTTDPSGAGSAESTVAWTFPDDRRPKSVVMYEMQTSGEPEQAGIAGREAACLNVEF